ncbi:MAG TPA: Calx-beta domain-containing protein [Pyrinomonadaceae bacterium]
MLRLRTLAAFVCLALALCLLGLWSARSQSSALRRITNTTEEGININPSLSGNGRRIAFESTEDLAQAGGANSFRAIRADISTDPATFSQLGATRAPAPGISQDGSIIAFASKDDPLGTNTDGNSEIFYFDGSALRQITRTTPAAPSTRVRDGNFQPSLTDDGRFIAFSSNRNLAGLNGDNNLEIFVFDTSSNTFTQLTNTSGTVGASDAKISGDGTRVAYLRDNGATQSTQRDLVLQDRIGGTTRILASNVTNLAFTYGRAISDDGSRIVYAADIATNSSQVFLFDGRTTNATRQITALGVRETEVPLHPTISGDGTRIAFATRRPIPGFSNTDNSIELYTYDIPTGQYARVTNAPSNADGFSGSTRLAEVVSSLNDDGSIVAFNFPRTLSGAVVTTGMENNSEIYATGTAPRPTVGTLTILNEASFGHEPATDKAIAPDSNASALGGALAFTTEQAQKQNNSFPTTLGGTTVTVNGRRAQISFVSPTRVNFIVPHETELGTAEVIVTNSEGFQSKGNVTVLNAAPGIFTYSGDGVGEAVVLNADTLQPGPFDPTSGNLRLIIFTTGVRHATQVTATAGGRALTVESFIPSPDMPGMDEVHVLVPSDLRGAGPVNLVVRADNRDSNPAIITFSGNACRDIVINEFLADPPDGTNGDANHDGTRSGTDDEFVELVNTTDAHIDISGYQLLTRSSTATSDTVRHTFPSGTLFPARSAIVIFGGGTITPTNPAFGGAQVFKASSGGLSLNNAGGVITFRTSSQEIVNIVTYGGSTGLDGDSNQSLTRSPDAGDGTCGNFVLHSTAPNSVGPFSPGTRANGTPFATGIGRLTSVSISPPSASVTTGQTTQFTAQARDQFNRPMTGVTITFASDNTAVATVDGVTTDPNTGIATATVTGRSAGTAHITAQATDGTTTVTSSQATLTVNEPPPSVSRVEVAPANSTINRGQTQQFTATAFDQNNQPVANATFTWSSSDTNVATINSNGLATGVGIGTVTITASTLDATGTTTSGTASLVVQVPLVINEILADPPDGTAGDSNRDGTRDADDDEFVELVNNSNAPVDISGVIVADSTSNRFTFPANTTLAAGRAVVIFGGGNPPTSDPAFGGALIFTTSSLSLGNTGDTVNVKLPVGGVDIQIATHTYAAEGNDNQSLTRSPDLTGEFVKHTTAANADGRAFSPGTRADGTPFGSPPITRIEVTPPSATANIGQTQGFTARAFSNTGGPEIEVQNVSFIWDSSDPTKATVQPATGQTTTATALATGSTTIRARAGGQQGTATLTVNPPPPTLTINDVSANEGNTGTTTFTFTVSLSSAAPAGGVTFDIATADGTATVANNDYVARSLTGQTIAAGNQTYTFDVTVNGDTVIEPSETFFVNVTNVSGATLTGGDGQGQGTIQNDDSATLSINDVSATEGNSGTKTFTFTVSLSLPAPGSGVTFDIATQDNTATTANNDYVAKSLTGQTIPTGQQTYTFDVTVNGDTLVEADETFFVNVTNVSGADVGDAQGLGTIQNDDTANLVISQLYQSGGNAGAVLQNDFIEIFNRGTTTVDFSVTPYSVQYVGTTGSFGSTSASNKTNITSGTIAPGQYFLVQEASGGSNGSALPTPDASGSINMSATSGKVALVVGTAALPASTCPGDDGTPPLNPNNSIIADFVGYGSTATATGQCYEGSGPAPAPSATTADLRKAGGCTDTNNNAADFFTFAPNPRNTSSPLNNCSAAAPSLSINDVSVTEGNGGTVTATFTVQLSAPAQGADVTFDIATADGTAQDDTPATEDNDYVAKSLTNQIIPAGQQTYTFTVTVNGDTAVEPNETFFVNVTNVAGATVSDGQGTGTIQNDDNPTLSINDVAQNETNTGTTTFTFTVSLSAPAPSTVTFDIATADDTAQDDTPVSEDNDYVARSLTGQTIAAGSQTYTFDVTVNGDTSIEPNETFFVNVTNVTGATVSDGQGLGTIQNDDSPPTLSINDVTQAETNSGTTTFTFTVQLSSSALAGGVTFDIATADDTALAGSDYVARSLTAQTIPEGSQTFTFDVTVNGDTIFEPNETFFVNVTSVTGATVTDGQGVGTITNDDAQPTLTIADASVTEGNAGTSLMTFTVTLTGTAQSTVSVNYATADSSATVADNDYASTSGTLNFTPGDTSETFTVTINGDTNAEGDEMFLVNLSGATVATIADSQALGTIFLDDPFSIAALNTAYTENFDVLAQSGVSSTTPAAWTRAESGTSANTTYTANNGSSTTGDTYSYGTTGASDRALGGLRTGSLVPTFGAFFRNDTSSTINTLQISYTGEEWRLGNAGRTDRIDFQYSTSATSLTTGTWTDVDPLDFTTPNTTTTGAKDGNDPANRTAISHTITGLSIAPGATVWIRWTDLDATGSDDGLAVDDFSITAGITAATPALSINDVTQAETNSGTTTFNFTVQLSSPAGVGGVSFTVNTADGTTNPATAGSDYVAIVGGSGSITEGNSSTTVSVTVNGDTTTEPNETFFVNITGVTGATAGDTTGLGTITNDDAAATPQLVISQVYGGGSNSGAAYGSDFVQLFNRGTATIDFSVTPYSVQYASAAGTFSAGNKVDLTTGTVAPGQYFLIKLAPVTPTVGTNFTADVTNTGINMSATDGKVALVLGTTVATTTTGCPTGVTVVDLLGYGSANCSETTPTAVLSATKVAVRNSNGCTDTGNNASDFTVTTVNTSSPVPKNSSAAPSPCP